MIQSVMNIQTAYAKALLVDEDAVAAAQAEGDVLGAHRLLLDGLRDRRPAAARRASRGEQGVEADPVAAFRGAGPRRAPRAPSAASPRVAERVRAGLSRACAVRIALFVTCIGDTVFPEAARATVQVLERLGHEVVFPAEQTCCGQMHANSGYRGEALDARAPVRRRLRRVRGRRLAVVVVRRQRARAVSAAGARGRRRRARAGGARARAAGVRAVGAARQAARRRGRRRVVPAPRRLPPDLPLAARDARRRGAA